MKYEVIDNSSDKKYFTIVPNYILNHCSGIDKGLYLDMKRMAGEDGICFMTEETLCKRNRIGGKQLHKSLKYLLDHNWITFIGRTGGKTRPIKTYKINNIWKENVDFYEDKKIVAESGVSQTGGKDTRPKKGMIPAERGGIRITKGKEELITNNEPVGSGVKSIKEILPKTLTFTKSVVRGGATHQWQDTAVRWWQKLGFKGSPTASWFRLFKINTGMAERACSWASDSGGNDLEKLTYWAFNQFKKNGKIVYEKK